MLRFRPCASASTPAFETAPPASPQSVARSGLYARKFRAEPSIEQAAAYMREVYEHRDEARARAQRSQAETQPLLSLEAAGKRMRARLDQIATA